MKNFIAKHGPSILAWIIEVVLVVVYLIIGFEGIMDGFASFDFEAMFEAVDEAILFLTIATFVVAMCFLLIKPLRNKTTRNMAIVDLVWVASNVYYMITSF